MDGTPVQCPRCRSPYWDRERLNGEGRDNKGSGREGAVVRSARRDADRRVEARRDVPDNGNKAQRVSSAPQHGPDESAGGDEEAVKLCKSCECALGQKNGFWYCPDLTGCALGGKQQGKVSTENG
jgi:hypothetical protein